jgi:hypothetical protein
MDESAKEYKRMIFRISAVWLRAFALTPALAAATLTPSNLNPSGPFAVQPNVGLSVTSGVTEPFFSDLSGLMFPGPTIVDILANVQAFDASGDPITSFQLTGVTVTEGSSTFTPVLEAFSVSSPITYTSTVNPFDQVTIDPGTLNLAFVFDSDSSFLYSSTFDVSGIPTGGFMIFGSIEAPKTPEPNLSLPAALVVAGLVGWTFGRRRQSA